MNRKSRKKRNIITFGFILFLNISIVTFITLVSIHLDRNGTVPIQAITQILPVLRTNNHSRPQLILDSLSQKNPLIIQNPLFIGDSLTAGRGSSSDNNSFPEQTLQMLHTSNLQSKNIIGRAGYTAGYMFNTIDPAKNAQNADLMVIELGTNDILDKASGYTTIAHLANFEDSYRGMLNDLRQTAPKATLVCLSIWLSPQTDTGSGLQINDINNIIQNQCLSFEGTYVDITNIYDDTASHTAGSDWFHPNDYGHKQIAIAIINSINKKIKKEN